MTSDHFRSRLHLDHFRSYAATVDSIFRNPPKTKAVITKRSGQVDMPRVFSAFPKLNYTF